MKNRFLLILLLFFALSLLGCQKTAVKETVSDSPNETSINIITDLGGNTVRVPPAADLNRIVVLSPPVSSIIYSVLHDSSRIIAVNPLTFKNANPLIIPEVLPNRAQIDTGFVKEFSTNPETILKLQPDIVFYYGPQQKAGLKNLNVPMVDFWDTKDQNPVSITCKWEKLITQIFQTSVEASIQDEWEKSNQQIASLQNTDGTKLRGLIIFNNVSNKITVCGNDSYGDFWLETSGVANAADDLKGEMEVNMEQIYQWNPDIIFVFMGEPASRYLKGIPDQDWSMVKAVKEKRVYDIPQGIFSWAAPNADSPLMPQWIFSTSYPERFSETQLRDNLKEYYKSRYHIDLSDDMEDSILQPHNF